MLEAIFKLSQYQTTPRREAMAGATTFLAMSYIIFVNPEILSAASMDRDEVFVATCIAAVVGSLIMGLYANYPIALAPGMGLNAYFAFTVVLTLGHSWQTALGAIFLSGFLFLVISVSPVRAWLIGAIPKSQKMAISAEIGLLLGIVALESAGVVVAHKATLVTVGDLTRPETLLACLGFLVIAALDYRKVPGAILIGILLVTVLGIGIGLTTPTGVFAPPPSLRPTFLALDIPGALDLGLVTIVFTFSAAQCSTPRGLPDRRLPARGLARRERTNAALEKGAGGGCGCDHGGCRARHLDHHVLHRKPGGHPGRRAHGADDRCRRRLVPAGPVLRAPGRRRVLRRLRHVPGAGRH